MKMNEFMTALQTHLAIQQPNYPDNAESILEVLFDAYNESSGFDNAAIKADFEELYRLINGKPLMEIDEIIYIVFVAKKLELYYQSEIVYDYRTRNNGL